MSSHHKDSELTVLTKNNKNYSYLQLKIQEVLRRRKISFKEFTRLLREATDIDQIEFLRLRNNLTNDIFNKPYLSYFSFEFLITKVLNEPELLNDPEVILIKRLGKKGLDLRNKRFGSLTAIELVDTPEHIGSHNNFWKCQCDCGNEIITNTANLGSGHTTSCGCYFIDKISTHSMCDSPEYATWESMKARCNNTNNSQYYNYGGRGISVCDQWINSFINLYSF